MIQRFRFTWDGQTWHTGELTGAEIVDLEKTLGISWGQLAPVRYMHHRLAVMATFLCRDRDETEVHKILDAATLDELEGTCELVPEDQEDIASTWEDGLPLAEASSTST